jgi:glutamate-1-semialdehyde 2,1-aminomutase
VLHYGTHNAGRLALSVTKTMLEVMFADGAANYKKLAHLGVKMTEEIRRVAAGHNRHRLVVQNVNSMFQIFFTDAPEINDYRDFSTHVNRTKFRDFALRLMDKGIYMSPSATLHSLSSIVHRDEDIAITARAIGEVLDEMP